MLSFVFHVYELGNLAADYLPVIGKRRKGLAQ